MGKDLRGKELGRGISQREDGLYVARYTNKYGKRVQKVLPKLQELRQWLADAQYKEEHSNIDFPDAMTVNAWFEYWIGIKKRTVRPNTVRNYTERYHRNIEPIIGNKMLGSVNTIHCQTIMNRMADEGYRTSTIYQTRIALFNMLDYAYQNDVILKNPCNKMVKSEIGKQSRKKQALTLGQQKEFCKVAVEILKLQKQKNRTFKVIPMLGHSNIGITMNLYVHTTEEQKHKEIDLVADALKVI